MFRFSDQCAYVKPRFQHQSIPLTYVPMVTMHAQRAETTITGDGKRGASEVSKWVDRNIKKPAM